MKKICCKFIQWISPFLALLLLTQCGSDLGRLLDGDKDGFSVKIIVAGYSSSGGYSDWWIKKFDMNGNEDIAEWDKRIDGGNGDDKAHSVAVDSNNNVYIVGYRSNGSDLDWWIKRFDSSGIEDADWNMTFDGGNGDDEALSAAVDSFNNVYVVGYRSSGSDRDWWIKMFDSNGIEDPGWDLKFDSGSEDDESLSVAVFH